MEKCIILIFFLPFPVFLSPSFSLFLFPYLLLSISPFFPLFLCSPLLTLLQLCPFLSSPSPLPSLFPPFSHFSLLFLSQFEDSVHSKSLDKLLYNFYNISENYNHYTSGHFTALIHISTWTSSRSEVLSNYRHYMLLL